MVGKLTEPGAVTVGTGGTMPSPSAKIVCGLPEALSNTCTLPVRSPEMSGVKVTEIVHEAAGATVTPHVVVCAKSPEEMMFEMASGAEPTFMSVATCGLEVVPTFCGAKSMLVGARFTTGTGIADPVPEIFRTSGLVTEFDAKLMFAERAPAAVGVKVTLTVQDSKVAIEAMGSGRQVSVSEKSPALAPVTANGAEKSSCVAPVFVSVTGCVTDWPIVTVPKPRDVGERDSAAAFTASVAVFEAALLTAADSTLPLIRPAGENTL